MVEHDLPKVEMRVRFPLPAQNCKAILPREAPRAGGSEVGLRISSVVSIIVLDPFISPLEEYQVDQDKSNDGEGKSNGSTAVDICPYVFFTLVIHV